jgi:aspartate kinase
MSMSLLHGPSLLVVKFGGTSLATPDRVRRATARLAALRARGHALVVVVSAAAGTTDRILDWLQQLSGGGPTDREADRALATGEALSAAFLATALTSRGIPARSLSGGEAGLVAEGRFGAGELRHLDPSAIRLTLDSGFVPVVAGFQAALVDSGETVTLGRGASDLTAVFLAARLGAAECHIVTDVDGVYTDDPRRRPAAERYTSLSHDGLCEVVHRGARVVHTAAADLARDHGVPLRIYHFHAPTDRPGGTTVGGSSSELELPVSA